MPCRVVRFAQNAVAIEHPDDVSGLIDFLFCDTESGLRSEAVEVLRIVLHSAPSHEWQLVCGTTIVARTSTVTELAVPLMEETLRHIVTDQRPGLAFHAAALARGGSGFLLPGESGAGKSSLAAWLTAHGFDYLGDELAVVGGGGVLDAFTRPIQIKSSGADALHAFLDMRALRPHILTSGATLIIPAARLRPHHAPETATLAAIVFPHFRARAELVLTRMTRAEAGLALMKCLVNARNLADHGFTAVTELVRKTRAYRLEYGEFAQLDRLAHWLQGARFAPGSR